jgi:hypothetical protein
MNLVHVGPDSAMFTVPSQDDPQSGIVITYVSWRNLWMWRVFFWSESTDLYTELTNDNGQLDSVSKKWWE